MLKPTAKNAMFLGLVAFGLLAIPQPSLAAGPFDWLCPWHNGPSASQQATTYAPPYMPAPSATPTMVSFGSYGGAPACNTCPTPGAGTCGTCVSQTCNYRPQTTYRWTYSRVKRLSYKPVVGCDPCSGQRVTRYQQVETKTLLPWLHQVPVTTQQLVCSPTSVASGWSSCSTCSSGFVSAGSGSSCSSCVGGSSGTASSVWQNDSSYSSSPPPTYATPSPLDPERTEVQRVPATEGSLEPKPDTGFDPTSIRSPGLNAPAEPPTGPMAIRSIAPDMGIRPVSFETPSRKAPVAMTPFGPDAKRQMEEAFRRASGQ